MTDAAPVSAPSPAPSKKAKKPFWRRMVKWTFQILLLLVVLAIVAYAITDYWTAHAIHAEVARIRAAKEPLTFEDLDRLTPRVDRAQDAGPYYTAAMELVDNTFYEDRANDAFFPQPATISPDILARAHRSLEQNHIALDLLDRGSALPGCNCDLDLQFGIAVALDHLGKPRALQYAASLRSRVLAYEGHGDQAVDSVISSLGLLRVLDRQPVMIGALVQVSLLYTPCQDAVIVMEQDHLSDTMLQKLDTSLSHVHLIQPQQMFIAERVYYLETMRNVIASTTSYIEPGDDRSLFFPERNNWTHLGLTGRIMTAETLPTYDRYIRAATGDFPGILTASQAIADTPASFWDKIGGPSFAKSMLIYAHTLAMYRSTLIALQIERYRRAHNGTLPETLADLPNAKDFPADPFTGNPLLYVKTPDGYCVMSAGRNHPEDDSRHIDRDKDPIGWSQRWGIHIRTNLLQ